MLHGDSQILMVKRKLSIFLGWSTAWCKGKRGFTNLLEIGQGPASTWSFAQQLEAGKHYSYMALEE